MLVIIAAPPHTERSIQDEKSNESIKADLDLKRNFHADLTVDGGIFMFLQQCEQSAQPGK